MNVVDSHDNFLAYLHSNVPTQIIIPSTRSIMHVIFMHATFMVSPNTMCEINTVVSWDDDVVVLCKDDDDDDDDTIESFILMQLFIHSLSVCVCDP